MNKMLTTRNIALMSMFIAMEALLSKIESMWFVMPQGGTISISIVAVLLASYILGLKSGVIVGIGSSILQFILGDVVWYGIYSYLFDYVFGMLACGCAVWWRSGRINWRGNNYFIFTGVIMASVIKFLGHFLAGWLLFAEYATGPVIKYSIVYNGTYMLPTLILSYIVFSIVYPTLKRFRRQ